jgi:hypothetical protein
VRFVTASGAVYRIEDGRAMRESGPYSPGINYDIREDGEWAELSSHTEVTIGRRVLMNFIDGSYRESTSVVDILEDE